jgi:hypothetical protein
MAKAFAPRFPPRYGKNKHHSKPLTACLVEEFGDQAMFAGVRSDQARGCAQKVAVTATTELGENAVIFANYNRRRSDSEGT